MAAGVPYLWLQVLDAFCSRWQPASERRLGMKYAAVVSFAFLLGPFALAAQSTAEQPAQASVYRLSPTSIGCPIAMRAKHGADGNILKVDKNRPKGLAQLLHLILTNPDSRRIVGANVRIHGLSGKARVTQAETTQDTSDVTRTFEVRFSSGTDKEVSSDLWVPGVTAVLSVELNSVAFADGSKWKLSGLEACRIVPDHFMLIADR
jgi:hypothetical protein